MAWIVGDGAATVDITLEGNVRLSTVSLITPDEARALADRLKIAAEMAEQNAAWKKAQ